MSYQIYNPSVSSAILVNTYDNAAALTWAYGPAVTQFDGKYFIPFMGSVGDYGEGVYSLWMVDSDDAVTWSDPYTPLRDAAYATNPITSGANDGQPGIGLVGDELWIFYGAPWMFLAKLSSASGKWTNYRFDWIDETPVLTTTISGAATPGTTHAPNVDGGTSWGLTAASDLLVTSTGAILFPISMYDSDSGDSFTDTPKWNLVMRSDDGGDTWTSARVPTRFGAASSWEFTLFEDQSGKLYAYQRNLYYPYDMQSDMFVVSTSLDDGRTWTTAASTGAWVPNSRPHAFTAGGRNVLLHCDQEYTTAAGYSGRQNGSIFISRRGTDLAPGVNFSGSSFAVNYPQGYSDGDRIIISFSSGYNEASDVAAAGRHLLNVVTVTPPPEDGVNYVHPRARSEFKGPYDPTLVSDSPDYWLCNGYQKLVSSTSFTPATGVTYTAWVRAPYENDDSGIIDNREALNGALLRCRGGGVRSLNLRPWWDFPVDEDVFVAVVYDHTALTATFYMAYGQADFLHKTTCYYKKIAFSGPPSNGETITIDGVVYTFKTTPVGAHDVQIGTTAATVTALASKIQTEMDPPINMNCTSNYGDTSHLVIARPDGADFTITSGSAAVTSDSSISFSAGEVTVGGVGATSSVSYFRGRLYDGRAYSSALSEANVRNVYNSEASAFGYSTMAGTSTAPSSPTIHADADAPSGFTSLGTYNYCEVVDADTLVMHGEASASVELPYGATQINLRWKVSDSPTSSERYVVATFGAPETAVRVYLDADDPTSLMANGVKVQDVVSPTEWNVLTAIVTEGWMSIGDRSFPLTGSTAAYLGNAYPNPSGLLGTDRTTTFDVSAMEASRA